MTVYHEKGIEIPYDQLNRDTLRQMIQEFVSRDGADWGDPGCTLEDKVEQVLQQLRSKKVKVVFDFQSQTANLVVSR
ncbi:YheU family protein [uncultured Desulfuromusa sp.]|uniref:YheU family protein n=1 Tax=uncultured Desulfuromusa sp. TaxID=219183 RepID=UPI002AA9381B|nr:YheU family protein [uncultured Desulfuromusa sp.]